MWPVKPGQLVVLAVGIVVAGLRTTEFIAPLQHRHALCQEKGGQQRTLQAVTPLQYNRILGFAFFTAIRGEVVPMTVAVVLAIEFIMLVLITDEVAQGKTIMGGNEIDSRLRCPSGVAENLARASQALGHCGRFSFTGQPESPGDIAKAVVPF